MSKFSTYLICPYCNECNEDYEGVNVSGESYFDVVAKVTCQYCNKDFYMESITMQEFRTSKTPLEKTERD